MKLHILTGVGLFDFSNTPSDPNMLNKPPLAEDADLATLKFPCWGLPKIDGVRGMNLTGRLTGRSFDEFKGFGLTKLFSKPEYVGFDGELIVGNCPFSTDRLCSVTSGAVGRFKGVTEVADFHWYIFDFITAVTVNLPYKDRYMVAAARVESLNEPRIHLVPFSLINNLDEANNFVALCLDAGYEGVIWRNPEAPVKPGRSSASKAQEYLRTKPWADAEILVTGITEGNKNGNEAKKNTLGRTERSSAKAGQIPNGQVGSIQGTLLADFIDPITKKLLFPKDQAITVSSGAMTVEEAIHYFLHPEEIVGHIVKFQHMTHGVKDEPRFPGYLSHRARGDL